MEIRQIDCLDLLCPSFNHPYHNACHLESYETARLLKIIKENKENMTLSEFKDFEIRDLTISLLFFDSNTGEEYEFFLHQTRLFNGILANFIEKRKLK